MKTDKIIDKTKCIKETLEFKNNEEFEVIKIDNKTITIKNDRLEAHINHKQLYTLI